MTLGLKLSLFLAVIILFKDVDILLIHANLNVVG